MNKSCYNGALATSDQRIAMLTQALSAASDMFKENARVIGLLEDKAQKAAGLAGIFLAAAFSFLRKDSLESLAGLTGWIGIGVLAGAIFTMLLCILCSAYVLWTKNMLTPPDPEKILTNVDLRLRAAPDSPSDESRENNLREQTRAWIDAVKVQQEAIDVKSKLLTYTQRLLLVGIAAVAALLILSIYTYGLPVEGR